MKYLKIIGLAAVAAMALTAFLGTGSASAQTLYKYTTPSANDGIAAGTEIISTLESGTSAVLTDTLGGVNDTCPGSEVKASISTNNTTDGGGAVSILSFIGCGHTTHVLANGSLEIRNQPGTTNGTVISKGARVTIKSTIFGVSCVANTGAGTAIGTITGAKAATAKATIDINGVITLENGCGDSTWTGSYEVTSPLGLTVDS